VRPPSADRKTILHVIPTLTGGGAERQLALLAAEQARRGWKVHIALRRSGNYAEHLTGSSVVLHELGDLRRGHPLLFVRLHALVRRIKPDVLQTWLLQMDIIGGAVALATRTPWVLTERNSTEAYDETPVPSWIRCRLGRRASAIVANSRDGALYWQEILPTDVPACVVPNAVDIESIRAMEQRTLIPATRSMLLCVGRLVPQKAPENVIHALSLLPDDIDVHLVLLGDGPLRQQVVDAIAAHSLGSRITLLPYQADWWGLLKSASALINVSRFEGQPNVVLEAMAAGCPLIVSDIPPHREILDETGTVFVPRDDSASLAKAIVSVVSDPSAARVRAAAAIERVARSTINGVADSYEHVYSQLVSGSAS